MDGHTLRREIAESMREIVFGLEDAFVSTLGAVTGMAAGAQNTEIVILSGLVIISVEALSMSAGSYLSNKSANEAEDAVLRESGEKRTGLKSHLLRSAVVMGVFYTLGGIVPLAPYFFLPIAQAYVPSIVLTALCLFALGAWALSFSKKRSAWKGGWRMAAVSLTAAALGFVIGRAVNAYYGGMLIGL